MTRTVDLRLYTIAGVAAMPISCLAVLAALSALA